MFQTSDLLGQAGLLASVRDSMLTLAFKLVILQMMVKSWASGQAM